MPFSELSHYRVNPAAKDLLPLDYCLQKLVVVLGSPDDAELSVGMVDTRDRALLVELKETLARGVTPVQLNMYEVRRALARLHGLPAGGRGISVQLSAGREISFAPERTVPELIDDLLSVAVQQGATDAHLETYDQDVDLRFRLDGHLRQVTTPLSPENILKVVSRLKVLCDSDMLEHRRPQDGHFGAIYMDGDDTRRIDFRCSFAPGPLGEDVVVRVLDPKRFRLELNQLGMPEPVLARYRRLLHYPDGLILCVGPTASGKTNTLYASVAALRGTGVKIVSCEDPIEYQFDKVNQKQVSPEVDFADWVRAFLRQNPDLLLVGEIRDKDTAQCVVQAATTGHLILSTLHTRNAVSAIVRLRTLGVPDDYLAHILLGVVAQRLLASNCPHCLETYSPDPELVAAYYPDTQPSFQRGQGCDACAHTGYAGLFGVFELLEIDRETAGAIGRGATGDELLQLAQARGFVSLRGQALDAAANGQTTLEEVARRIEPSPL